MNEDLVQLDDDEDIPLPPEPQAEHKVQSSANEEDRNVGSDLYEPENPTEEQEDDDQNGINAKPVDKDEREAEPSPSHTPAGKEPEEDDETKTRSTPSPTLKDARTVDRGKGVLELYDDSDWEELEIDKPKEFEKALVEETPVPSPVATNNETTEGGPSSSKNSSSETDPDRSYTPCLDEKTLEEEAASGQQTDKSDAHGDAKKTDSKRPKANIKDEEKDKVEEKRAGSGGIGTELISEDENLTNENETKRRSRSRSRSRHCDCCAFVCYI